MKDTIRYKTTIRILQKADVILSLNTDAALSSVIKNVTDSEYSHTMIYLGNGNILESTFGGTRISPLSKYIDYNHDICILRPLITDVEKEIVIKESLKLVGKRYGYFQLFYYLFLRVIRQSENPKWHFDVEPNALVCSEAIALAFSSINNPVKPYLRPSQIEPVDFLESMVFTKVLEWPVKISLFDLKEHLKTTK